MSRRASGGSAPDEQPNTGAADPSVSPGTEGTADETAGQRAASTGFATLPPSPAELDCLAVLWNAEAQGTPAIRLSEIHKGVVERRRRLGGNSPALTTVSTQLRTLRSKGLILETTAGAAAGAAEAERVRRRGMLTPTTRSPLTAYQAAYRPEFVLQPTLRELATAFPLSWRAACVCKCVGACGYDELVVAKIYAILKQAKPKGE